MIDGKEIEWMLSNCSLRHDAWQLRIDYGEEAEQMLDAFEAAATRDLLPLLAWHGIGTRWRYFLEWFRDASPSGDLEELFAAFAQHLGRLTSYRALALTEGQYQAQEMGDAIVASGAFKTDEATLRAYCKQQGLRQVLEKRINQPGALTYDPSLSLHDYPETAVSVAAGYLKPGQNFVYRFELDLPLIETVGWRMCDVNGWVGWFSHRGIWHDPTNPRTERFLLLAVPFLSQRCPSVRRFNTQEEIEEYVRPFIEQQDGLRRMRQQPVP